MEQNESLTQFETYLRRRFPDRRTPTDYVSDIRQFMRIIQKPWREVSMHDIDDFVNQQKADGLKLATVNRRVAALKTFFDFLAEEEDDLSWLNPVRYKRHAGKRSRSLPRDMHDEEIERIWQVIVSSRDRAWFALMVRGGLRVGEVVNLKKKDILHVPDQEHPAQLRICGKGRKERVICLSGDAYAVLETWLAECSGEEGNYIFLNEKGKKLSTSGIEWLLHGYGRQVGIEVTPHQLRHTFARQLTEAGMPVTSLGKLLGHAQITTTQIYTAGADPGLSEAYQTAMSQLEQTSAKPSPAPPTEVLPLPEPVVPTAPEANSPSSAAEIVDWDKWAPHLPSSFRQASLDYVKQRLFTWPAVRRRARAMNLLNEFLLLWDWFRQYRPISHPGELSLKDLRAYQTDQIEKKYAAGTINRRLDYIIGILRQLAEEDEAVDNSVFRLRYLPRPESLPRHLTTEQCQRLETYLLSRLFNLDPTVRLENACLFMMLHSGLRRGECTDIRFQDLDLPAQRLIVRQGKGQRDRLVYLSSITCQAIQLYLQASPRRSTDPLWLYPNGKPMCSAWLADHVSKIGKVLDIYPLSPHRLRHTCATRLLNAGMDITRIQKLLGHEMISTTMIYAKVQDATVEADYRQALCRIQNQQMPFSNTPISVDDWPSQVGFVQNVIDDSV